MSTADKRAITLAAGFQGASEPIYAEHQNSPHDSTVIEIPKPTAGGQGYTGELQGTQDDGVNWVKCADVAFTSTGASALPTTTRILGSYRNFRLYFPNAITCGLTYQMERPA